MDENEETVKGCKAAAAILGVHPHTVQYWASQRFLPASWEKGSYVFRRADLEAFQRPRYGEQPPPWYRMPGRR